VIIPENDFNRTAGNTSRLISLFHRQLRPIPPADPEIGTPSRDPADKANADWFRGRTAECDDEKTGEDDEREPLHPGKQKMAVNL